MNGIKYDQDKPRMDLLDYDYLMSTARVMSYGAEKYSAYNWKGLPATRLFAALQRHLAQFWAGEDIDEESGLKHIHHASASLMMLASVIRDSPEDLDDRYVPECISMPMDVQRDLSLTDWLEEHDQFRADIELSNKAKRQIKKKRKMKESRHG